MSKLPRCARCERSFTPGDKHPYYCDQCWPKVREKNIGSRTYFGYHRMRKHKRNKLKQLLD